MKTPNNTTSRGRSRGRGGEKALIGSGKGKEVKPRLIQAESSHSSTDSYISSDGGTSEGVWDICQEQQPPPQTHRAIFGKLQWNGSDVTTVDAGFINAVQNWMIV